MGLFSNTACAQRHAMEYRQKAWAALACLALLTGLPASMAQAQSARLLEINKLYGQSDGSSPGSFCTIGDVSYFAADDGTYGGHGRELWVTDGTAQGTAMVADINGGTSSSDPQELTAIDSKLYFSADDGTNGRELWVYDGSGLVQVDVNPSGDSNPSFFCAFNGAVYFSAQGATGDGRELWKYDGVTATLVGDIHPSGGSDPTELVVMGTCLYFAADNGVDGRQVMRHEAGGTTTMIANVSYMVGYCTNPDELSAFPEELTVNGDQLYYTAEYVNQTAGSESTMRRELFVTDGTQAGTQRISDIGKWASDLPADASMWDDSDANVRELTVLDGSVYFIAHEPSWNIIVFSPTFSWEMYGGWTEIWKTDGTLAGTQRITQIGWLNEGSPDAGSSADAKNLIAMGGYLYFSATDGNLEASSKHNQELWRTDGAALGNEQLVKDINQYLTGSGTSGSPYLNQAGNPQHLCVVNTAQGERLFFQANNGPDNGERVGVELWMSDGTSTGTVLVQDILASGNGQPEGMTALGSRVVFSAQTPNNQYGRELYVSDGTDANTFMVADLAPGPSDSQGAFLTAMGETLFLSANDAIHGQELWKTNGTTETTELVRDILPGTSVTSYPERRPYNLTVLEDTLYFFQRDEGGRRPNLWKSDGTEAGTVRVHDFLPAGSPDDPQTPSEIGDPSGLTAFNGKLFFSAYDYNLHGLEFWTSDGTDAGTYELKDIYDEPWNPVYGDHASKPASFTVVDDTLYFSAASSTGYDLWKSDGTEEGTVLVKDLDISVSSLYASQPIGECAVADGRLFWVPKTSTYGTELWVSDGTTTGTTVTLDIYSGTAGSGPENLTALDAQVLFAATDGAAGKELWISDGTSTGTVLVKDIQSGTGSSNPQNMIVLNDRLFFSADDGTSGTELWVSDATATGTQMLKDIYPGASGSAPANLTVIPHSNCFIFTAQTPDAGRELWISDGTADGTSRLLDLAAGTQDSNPEELTVCAATLYFVASDGTLSGEELWALDLKDYMRFFVNFETDGTTGTVVNGVTTQTVPYGYDTTEVTAIAPQGYQFVKWTVDGLDYSTHNPLTLENITQDMTLRAVFVVNTYALTYTAGENGSLVGTTSQTVNHGENGTEVTAVPANGFVFLRWSDGDRKNPRTDMNVTDSISVTAIFGHETAVGEWMRYE